MKKKLGILLVIGIIGIVGGGIFFKDYFRAKKVLQSENTLNEKVSFNTFLQQGGSFRCSIQRNVFGVESKGIVYMEDKSIRGDVTTTIRGSNISTSFIVVDGYSYTWSSTIENKGFKVRYDSGTISGVSPIGMSQKYVWNAELIKDYVCVPWKGDATKFILPSKTVFTELKSN